MTNVIRNTIISCEYKTSSTNNVLTEKYIFFCNKKYAKKGTREFVQFGETAKIGCSEN
jgi:hypothetical protein